MLMMLSHARKLLEPGEIAWESELRSGWPGPDGSSCSLDNVEGIKIGETTRDYRPDLPANLHDFRYRVIRRLRAWNLIDSKQAAELRALADQEHYTKLMESVSILVGWNGWKARQRVRARYYALRLFGRRSTLPRGDETYERTQ